MRVYRPMRWKARREVATPRLVLIVSMSPPGYSSARLRPRRAGLRFTRRFQLTNGLDPNQVPLGSRHKISSTPSMRGWGEILDYVDFRREPGRHVGSLFSSSIARLMVAAYSG